MIVGIGTDLVDINRIEKILQKYGNRFKERCFTQVERDKAASRSQNAQAQTYAKRFAAKEACVKALGTGFVRDITLQDISVIDDSSGKPSLYLTGGAQRRLEEMVPDHMSPVLHLSLSDEPPYAQAFVVVEALPG